MTWATPLLVDALRQSGRRGESLMARVANCLPIPNPLAASVSLDVLYESRAVDSSPGDENIIVILSLSSTEGAGSPKSATVFLAGPWQSGEVTTGELLRDNEGMQFTLTSLPGELAGASTEGAMLEMTVIVSPAEGDALTIDNIRVEEQQDGVPEITLNGAQDLLNMNAKMEGLDERDFTALSPEERAADSFQRRVCYQVYRPGPEPVAIDLSSLGGDDLCLGNPQGATNATGIEINLVGVEEGEEEHEVIATYEFVRPEGGWASYDYAWVWACDDTLRSVDGGTVLSNHLGWIALRDEVDVYGLESPEVSNAEDTVTVDVRFATDVVTLDDFADGDIFVRSGSDQIDGTFITAMAAPEGEPGYVATYRLDRTEAGWPPSDESIRMVANFGNPAVATSSTRDLKVVLKTDVVEDTITVLLTSEGAPVGGSSMVDPSADRFTFPVTFSSANGIDLESLGDGDVLLERVGDLDLPGRLEDVEPSADGNSVKATYSFNRDPGAWSSDRVFFSVPSGAIRDLAGNVIRGQFAGGGRRLDQPDQDAIRTGFIPLSNFHPELTSYHFRVAYQSKGEAAINVEDLDGSHLEVRQRSVNTRGGNEIIEFEGRPQVESLRISDGGRLAEVDYSLTRSEQGWPAYFEINLRPFGVRDLHGNSVTKGRPLASLGPSFENQNLSAQLLAGQAVTATSESHRMTVVLQADEDFHASDVEKASLWLGWHLELLPGFEANAYPPAASGRLLRFTHIDGRRNTAVATYEIERPDGGWDRWEAQSIPFVFQGFAPSGYSNSLSNPLLLSGNVQLTESLAALPLLSSFEDWVKQLEEEAELPEGSLRGDLDGDQQDGLLEYALGGDPQDGSKQGRIETGVVTIDGQRYMTLTLSVRATVIGVTIEVQQSADGESWKPAFSEFELVERKAVSDGIEEWVLRSEAPLDQGEPGKLFRVVVAD